MTLKTLVICLLGLTTLWHTDLGSQHWFDGVVLPLLDFAFIIWVVLRLMPRQGPGGGSSGGPDGGWGGGWGGGDGGGCGGDGGGC